MYYQKPLGYNNTEKSIWPANYLWASSSIVANAAGNKLSQILIWVNHLLISLKSSDKENPSFDEISINKINNSFHYLSEVSG